MSTENIGSMLMNSKHRNERSNRPEALVVRAALADSVEEDKVSPMVTEHIGIAPMEKAFPEVTPVASLTSSSRCSATGGKGQGAAGFRGQDFNAELHLSLRDAAQTHKQILTVNGKQVRITIPAGVADGQVIKLKGYGAEGINGGPAGDLYITFVIAEDPVFKRLGDDLYVDVEIDLYTAVLGGEKIVDTLDSKVKLKIKPETQNGTKVRLKGKGFPVYKKEGQFGDLIVTYSVKIPTNLTDAQKELFRQLQSMN